jgi:hypothetical protein
VNARDRTFRSGAPRAAMLCLALVLSRTAQGEPVVPAGDDDDATRTETDAAAAAAADEEELAGTDVRTPPPKGKGAIAGQVTDTKLGEPVIEAVVQVVGRRESAVTDLDGRFRLELPPGAYTLRVSYELYRPSRAENVEVSSGAITPLDFELVPDEDAVQEVVVEEEADRSSSEGLALARKREATVSDRLGRAEIARTPDRNAAQRVVGATIVGGRFVFVRGLGERYTNALLDGTPLPSPEPDRQTVPLDLFPALVLDSVTITKQFSPDMPGDFAGGSVRIDTRDFPRETLLQLSLSSGYTAGTTFQDRLSTRASGTDWLGFDSGLRKLPQTFPRDRIDANVNEDARVFWARQINSYMSTVRKTSPPNHGVSAVVGDSFKIGQESKIGAVAAASYGRSYQIRKLQVDNYRPERVGGGPLVPVRTDHVAGEQGIDTVRWGAFGAVSLGIGRDHELTLAGLRSQHADNLASELEGYFESVTAEQRLIHLEYVSRGLTFGKLGGNHRFSKLGGGSLDWHASLARAIRVQPDTRDTVYQPTDPLAGEEAGYQFAPGTFSGSHFYSGQDERTVSHGLDYTQPIVDGKRLTAKAKVGGLANLRAREFGARRFVLEPVRVPGAAYQASASCGGAWQAQCPDQLFHPALIGPDGLMVRENTLQFDSYSAGLDVLAGYAMADVELWKRVRMVGGARLEVTKQRFTAYDPFDPEGTTIQAEIAARDVLPALSVVFFASPRSNTRFGLTRTLARPQLREITPFLSSSYDTGLGIPGVDPQVQGNPDLELTKITNLDLRFEHFPTLREVLAFSVFYKHFVRPIEEVIVPGSAAGIASYENADGADLIGVELEARQALGKWSPVLDPFTAIVNLTLAHSNVNLGDKSGAATNPSRPMSYQSPYIVNVALDYANEGIGSTVRLLYNVSGPRITRVGRNGLPDTYEQPRQLMDASVAQRLSKRFELKATGQNLFGSDVVLAQRGVRGYYRERRSDGSVVTLPGARDPIRRRYDPGTTINLAITYTH